MNRSMRTLAAVVTTATLTLTGQALQSAASAKPHSVGAHAKGGEAKGGAAKGDVTKVLRDITRTSAALDRTVRSSRIGTLAEDVQAAVVANVETDKAALAALGASVSAADSTLDLGQVRRDVRALRVDNYVLAVNVLRHAAGLQDAAAADAEAAALVELAVAKALTVTASSPKSLIREARADLTGAQELLDGDTGSEPTETVEPSAPPAPVVG